MRHKVKDILKETFIILTFSVLIAFIGNVVSPNGIALLGQWNTQKGVLTANPRDKTAEGPREIENISDVLPIFNGKKALFVDARDKKSYRESHIEGAVSLPVNDYDNAIIPFSEKYDVSQKIITYCSGRQCEDSHFLAENLYSEGYKNIFVFIDGFEAWEENALPVESEE